MEHVLLAVGIIGLVFVLATAVGAVVVVRGVRRRYRAIRARLRLLRLTPPSHADLHRLARASGSAAAATLGSPGWWQIQNRRHRMWRAVSSAQHAVNVARRADVAVGDLPALASRLNEAAKGVDAVLRASGRDGSPGTDDDRDFEQIVAAATDLRGAALSTLRAGSHLDTDAVVSDVRLEMAALAAGVRASHR